MPSAARVKAHVAALHQAIYQANQARIHEAVEATTHGFATYEKTYLNGLRRYQAPADHGELQAQIRDAQVVYVGDYHTLPRSQKTFLKLLSAQPEDQEVTVALEFVQGRHQKWLDAYMRHELDAAKFLDKIGYRSDWGFHSWPNVEPILALARARGYQVIGIDTLGRGPASRTLPARDLYAAKRIAAALKRQPRGQVFVLVGDYHIAPDHLPAAVLQQWQELHRPKGRAQGRSAYLKRPRRPRHVMVYQNSQGIYRALAAKGLEHEVDLVRVARDRYCLMHTPPIVCQQSFLSWLDADDAATTLANLTDDFHSYVAGVAGFFELAVPARLHEVELASVVDLSFVDRLRDRGVLTAADWRHLRRQIVRGESYTIPKANLVYIGKLSVNHVAEEATHYLRHTICNCHEPRLMVDAFYARCLEEAVGFLGSKIINPRRKAPSVQSLTAVVRAASNESPSADAKAHATADGTSAGSTALASQPQSQGPTSGPTSVEVTVARYALRHLRMEAGKKVRQMGQVYGCDKEVFNGVVHVLGYRLGQALYEGLIQGTIAKSEVKELFYETFEEHGSALHWYLYFTALTRHASGKAPEARAQS